MPVGEVITGDGGRCISYTLIGGTFRTVLGSCCHNCVCILLTGVGDPLLPPAAMWRIPVYCGSASLAIFCTEFTVHKYSVCSQTSHTHYFGH